MGFPITKTAIRIGFYSKSSNYHEKDLSFLAQDARYSWHEMDWLFNDISFSRPQKRTIWFTMYVSYAVNSQHAVGMSKKES